MAEKYNEVHVRQEEVVHEIHPEFLYLTIPADYLCIYHKLLVYLADFGKEMLDDCKASCRDNNKTVLDCWNLFQSAIACRSLGKDREAKLFIDYIEKQLDNVYRGTDAKVYNGTNYYAITKDGILKALCSCDNSNPKFFVDTETGEMYQTSLDATNNGNVFTVEDGDLNVASENKV